MNKEKDWKEKRKRRTDLIIRIENECMQKPVEPEYLLDNGQ